MTGRATNVSTAGVRTAGTTTTDVSTADVSTASMIMSDAITTGAVEPPPVESERVSQAVAASVAMQEGQRETLMLMLDMLRSGSAASPQQAAWMKAITHAQIIKPAAVEQAPLHECTQHEVVCPITGRMLRPWPLHELLAQLKRYHVDLVSNPILKARMSAAGWEQPPCPKCGGETKYLGDSMSIESSKDKPTVTGGTRMMLCPNGLYSPCTFGVSSCTSASCECDKFDHIELLPKLPPSITIKIPVDAEGV